MIIYGRNAVREALRARRRPVIALRATQRAAREPWLAGESVEEVRPEALDTWAGSSDHQGVAAEVGPYPYADPNEFLRQKDPLLLALDEIQDPQNLGAIIRTAEAAGVTGVVICERRAAEVTPAVCKASAGAVEHLAVARVGNLADYLAKAKTCNVWSYGAAAAAPQHYHAVDWRGGAMIVLGAEGSGLRRRVADTCDGLVSIPMRGQVDSLNVSATGAILLFAAVQSRMHP